MLLKSDVAHLKEDQAWSNFSWAVQVSQKLLDNAILRGRTLISLQALALSNPGFKTLNICQGYIDY